ncbi:MUTSac [Nesidiocoris tenuis]|uniref:MUTSac n=1 Tax=Nesidiocoris tenuis TaxID=355587 RepID=A0ABN7B084_9HEMI|nr:MUTSac [Nesidiocoris tenuis]
MSDSFSHKTVNLPIVRKRKAPQDFESVWSDPAIPGPSNPNPVEFSFEKSAAIRPSTENRPHPSRSTPAEQNLPTGFMVTPEITMRVSGPSTPENIESCSEADVDAEAYLSSDQSGILLALILRKRKIAAACFNPITGGLYLLESVPENNDYEATILTLRSVIPSILIIGSSAASPFCQALKAKLQQDHVLEKVEIQCLAPKKFVYEFARSAVLRSSLWDGPAPYPSEEAKTAAVLSSVSLNDERLVCVLGGLLDHVTSGCPHFSANPPSRITSVQYLRLNEKLWIDNESFRNLQIFDPREHPSSFKWSSGNRDEGKSLATLFELHCSRVGATKLQHILANPTNNRDTLEKRHEVIDFFLDRSNSEVIDLLKRYVSQMTLCSIVMRYLNSPRLRGGHWKIIYRHIYYTVLYAETCRSHGSKSRLFHDLGSSIDEIVYSMAHNLERTIDLVNMGNNDTFVIKYGFSPQLDSAKEKYSRLKLAMDTVTPYEYDVVPPYITGYQMVYIPEMRFLLSIPFWAPDLTEEQLHLPNLEFKFVFNEVAFYKSRRCYELDELLGDAQTEIVNEESLILKALRNYLKQHMHHILNLSQKITEIECFFAMAKVAYEQNLVKPEILDRCAMEIRDSWHPLLELPIENGVANVTNDFLSSTDTSLVKLIYGPNACGKSVYLKQVGLCVYMTQIGSFVPARMARLGLLERIVSRSLKLESAVSMTSTLLSELKMIQDAVSGCTRNSLIILDEVVTGSTETNCIAILASALNYFLSLGNDCPHLLASTHLSGVGDFVHYTVPAGLEGSRLFEILVMDHHITETGLTFLYKVRQGRPETSYVLETIENAGLTPAILRTSRSVLEALRTGENALPYSELRMRRSAKYLAFVKRFVNVDMSKPGYFEKIVPKIQRYFEDPTYL